MLEEGDESAGFDGGRRRACFEGVHDDLVGAVALAYGPVAAGVLADFEVDKDAFEGEDA